ncbi:MAG: hypothetical protein QM493_10480 [Sulfurovum sp.]
MKKYYVLSIFALLVIGGCNNTGSTTLNSDGSYEKLSINSCANAINRSDYTLLESGDRVSKEVDTEVFIFDGEYDKVACLQSGEAYIYRDI